MAEGRKSSTSGKGKSEDKCLDCAKVVSDKDKGIQCEVCEGWYHSKCQQISDEAYEQLEANDGLHWYCKGCNRAVVGILKSLAGIKAWQERTEKELDIFRKDIAEIRKELKTVGNIARAAETQVKVTETMAKATETKLETVVSEGIEKTVESKFSDKVKVVKEDVAEALEMEKRRANIVFHGIKESVVTLDQLGGNILDKSPDQDAVEEILKTGLRLDATRHIEEVQRIGRYTEGKTRPLRVRVKTIEAKIEILKRARDLKQSEEYKHIFIAPDLTRKQQLVDKDLREKLKQLRSDGEENVKIKQGKIIKNEAGKGVVVVYQPQQ